MVNGRRLPPRAGSAMNSANRSKLSLRAVAKRCGVSHVAAHKAIAELRLPPLDRIADLDEAERLWKAQACPEKALVAERERASGSGDGARGPSGASAQAAGGGRPARSGGGQDAGRAGERRAGPGRADGDG